MRQIARREQFRRGWASFMGLNLSLGLIVSLGSVAPSPARAAQVTSKIKLDTGGLKPARDR